MTFDVGTSDTRFSPRASRDRTPRVRRGDPPRGAPQVRTAIEGEQSAVGRARRLWSVLPKEYAERFRPYVGRLAKAMVREIQQVVPAYAQPLNSAFGVYFTQAIEQAILYPLSNIRDDVRSHEDWREVFRLRGKLEFHEGRSLDCLQTAYRVGGRVAWRHIAEFGQRHGAPVEVLCSCAEAIFAYVDELSALSIEGYAEAQERAAGTMARRRRRLLELILADPPASPQTLADLANNARWKLPEWVTMIALEPIADQHARSTPSIDADVLVDLEGAEPCLLVAGQITDVAALESGLRGWRAAIGPHVRLSEAALSLRWARRVIGLVQRGILPSAPVTCCTDHLTTLWLLNDEFLIRELSARSLAPLDGLTVKQRARLTETLLAWLQSRGSAPELAERLGVHPQTIRYRMHQLERLFGDRLNDPDERLSLEVSLRAERLLNR
ncbi:PucR family transcriptional regulator [Saccharopolyspora hirsuta]|uniref:PucR family transcriptional regulator n=1 Tax=Saccharopolyspora hirsuta TaxID=1837 RepID=A0A5M7BF87_SACHI|nr:helix-turn-helix domain-containing protein [Saccharopolyspora hirsuta]KAA5827147.1 PucR family transcriptional regulator [Saccharopolyspora hirsuta]